MAEYQTLKLNSDFRRTYGRGKSAADPVLVTYALRNRYGVMRIGITTGKKLGNAVGYSYPHDDPRGVVRQEYLPENLRDRVYYEPTTHGGEKRIAEYIGRLRRIIRGTK